MAIPEVDGARQSEITDEQAHSFRENGLLIVRNLLAAEELEALRRDTQVLVEEARAGRHAPGSDFRYKRHEVTGEPTPFRVEYVVDKSAACRALLAHPFVLRSVERLQGRNFIPTWDSMVFKTEGAGVSIPWHRDVDAAQPVSPVPIFNVDFYLDEADASNCLWGVPGSNRWSGAEAQEAVERLSRGGFGTDGATPLPMQPGDVLFHDVLVVHGSAPAQSALRRVLYYEFRPAEVERELGPHTPEYLPLKQRVLLACLRQRAGAAYAHGEAAYRYAPEPPPVAPDAVLETYRYPHEDYWRAG